jgi:hypothetical protein
MDLLKDPCGSPRWHWSIHPKTVFFMREAILNVLNEVKATSKLKSQNGANIGVAIKVELDPKEVLEEVSGRASLKRRTETWQRENAWSGPTVPEQMISRFYHCDLVWRLQQWLREIG